MAVQPIFPNVHPEIYQCASCYVMANSYSNVPFKHCVAECKNVDNHAKKCIQTATAQNAMVLPENITCTQAPASSATISRDQQQTRCLAAFNQCTNNHI
jgi:hypothetical protein